MVKRQPAPLDDAALKVQVPLLEDGGPLEGRPVQGLAVDAVAELGCQGPVAAQPVAHAAAVASRCVVLLPLLGGGVGGGRGMEVGGAGFPVISGRGVLGHDVVVVMMI